MATQKVAISERALIQRITRKLKHQANPELFRAARTERQKEELGEYFTVEAGIFAPAPLRHTSQGVCRTFVDLQKLGRELGVLAEWEEVSS